MKATRKEIGLSDERREWLIYNGNNGQFWGPDSGGYFGLWGAGLYTEAEAKRITSNKCPTRRDRMHHISEYRDQIANMRGAFERLSAALPPADRPSPVVSPEAHELIERLHVPYRQGGGSRVRQLRAHLAGNVNRKALIDRETLVALLDAADLLRQLIGLDQVDEAGTAAARAPHSTRGDS